MATNMEFNYNDGGREAAGYNTSAGDCVARSIAIITGLPYSEVYSKLTEGNKSQKLRKGYKKRIQDDLASKGWDIHSKEGRVEIKRRIKYSKHTASHGINVTRKWFKDYMALLGFVWVPTMKVGSGCKVHLTETELPKGKLVINVSKHFTAVIDGVINDTYDCSRGGTRCVYGYYIKQ